jgi:hypothetical protein
MYGFATLKTIVSLQILMSAMKMIILAALGSARTHRGITTVRATQEMI